MVKSKKMYIRYQALTPDIIRYNLLGVCKSLLYRKNLMFAHLRRCTELRAPG